MSATERSVPRETRDFEAPPRAGEPAHEVRSLDRAPTRAPAWATTRQQVDARALLGALAEAETEALPVATARESGMRRATGPMVGRIVAGRFRLDAVLGRGGMGVVFAAQDVALGRPVVLKVLSRELARDPLAAARLIREARVAARITHPGIVAILDLGTLETGEPYLVMERLNGHDLGECLDAWGALAIDDALPILEQVADALAHLHAAGIVHRDVKPSNVFVLDGATPQIKLIDFGLALADDESVARLTQRGIIVGTAEYLAPELVLGAHPTARADTYALACVAYEMLAGAPPYRGTPLEVLAEKRNHPAPPLDELGFASRDVAAVVAQGMSLRVEDRPLPQELTRALRQAADRRRTIMPTPGSLGPVIRGLDAGPVDLPVDRRPLVGALLVILTLAIVLGAALLRSLG